MKTFLLLFALPLLASAQAVDVGGQIGGFHFAVSNYYHVPEREVIAIRERRLPDDDIPVALFLAQRARVPPATIVNLRLGGKPWRDIAVQYGVGPEAFYVPVEVVPGGPYGKAWGHYKKKDRRQWRTVVLDDDDIVTLVNVKFLADYHHTTPDRIIGLRPSHANFVAVYDDVGKGGKGKGKWKEKEKGKGHKD
jgi:hypothetical protein